MAVQAPYLSNVLHLNRNTDEKHDSLTQPQPGGLFINQSHFNNEAGKPCKRRRDGVHQTISIQSHNINISTGLRLYSDQQQQQILPFQSSPSISLLSEDPSQQLKLHCDEIDQSLNAQGEQLRRTLAEKRKRHYRALLKAVEESASQRLKEKEAEVEKATRRNAELEARAAQLATEAQAWQAKARTLEAVAASLQAQIQRAIVSSGGGGEEGVEAVEGQAEDAESAFVDPYGIAAVTGCRSCRRKAATVVVLPCRHLCLCTECDEVAHACPLCLHLKNSSVEVFLS